MPTIAVLWMEFLALRGVLKMNAAKKLELEQGTPEWLSARYDFVTASQTPILFDLSPYETRLGLFEEKVMRQEMRNLEGKEVLFARGHNAELKAREWLKAQGIDYVPAVFVNLEHPDLLASLDGIHGERILECKFVGEETLEAIRKGTVSPHHLCQVQTQLLVSEAKVCDYFATAPNGESHLLEITPDSNYQSEISIAASVFMNGVRNGEPPEPGEKDFFMPERDERFEILSAMDAHLKETEEKFEALKEELKKDYEAHRRVRYGQVTIVKSVKKGAIDYKKVPVLKGLDLEKYRKPSTEVVTVKVGKTK
jgi:putative phage-type endonuclease